MVDQCPDCLSTKRQSRIVDVAPIRAPIINPMREIRCLGCGHLFERIEL